MTHKVGKYTYKSQKAYERLLIRVGMIFVICLFLLFFLKDNMSDALFYFTTFVDVAMIIHLLFRYLHSKKKIKYIFNEY